MEKGEKKSELVSSIPIGIDIGKWKLVVRGLKQLGADEKNVAGDELAKLTNIHINTISNNLKFLHQLEFIDPDCKISSIKLTTIGTEFAKALIMKNETQQKEILSSAFKEKFKDLIAFYDLHKQNQDLNFEMLFNQIKLLSNSPDVVGLSGNTYPVYRTGIYTLINLLIFADIVDESYDPESNSLTTLKDKSSQPRTRSEVPIYCSFEWMKKLFQQVHSMNPQIIPKEFITANIVGSNHESGVLGLARFIGLIDKEGNRAENYEKLRLFGDDEFKENLGQIIKEKYKNIFSVANISTVERNNLETVFMKEYNLGQDHARKAVTVFVNLCQLSNIDISDSLLSSKKSIQKKLEIKSSMRIPKKQVDENQIQSVPTPTIPYVVSDSPFKINLNINLEIKDKETLSEVMNLIRDLKKEIRSPLPQLDVTVTEDSEAQSS